MAKNAHVRAFEGALAQARASAKVARGEAHMLLTRRKEINAIGKKISPLVDEENGDGFFMFLIGSRPHYHITYRSLPDFKCLKMESALWWLESIGTLVRSTDYPDNLNKEFSYDVDDARVTINAYVRPDSPTCRKVPVGTETVTKTKYEIQCD
jgi:hypothetical protein